MTPVSHALLPVFLGRRWISRPGAAPTPRLALLVAACGVLPDLLNPHLSLTARHAALSHSLSAWLIFTVLIGALAWRLSRVFTWRISLLCVLAYGGHLLCDGITGGVSLFLPFSTTLHGGNYLPYWMWTACDGALVLYLYLVYRWLPLRRKIRAHASAASPSGGQPSRSSKA